MGKTPDGSRIRIDDVAARAHVSVGTVSHTINHPELVSQRTRKIVERAIKELGFAPNQQARVLTGASSQVIGLVVLDVVSPFFMQAARAVERAAREAGHVVILCNSDNDADRETELLHILAAQRVRGALLTPSSTNSGLDRHSIQARRLPLVFLDYQNSPDDCSVSVNDVAGARLAVQHLLDLGHARVAFVGGGGGLRQHVERAQGAREAIAPRSRSAADSCTCRSGNTCVACVNVRRGPPGSTHNSLGFTTIISARRARHLADPLPTPHVQAQRLSLQKAGLRLKAWRRGHPSRCADRGQDGRRLGPIPGQNVRPGRRSTPPSGGPLAASGLSQRASASPPRA